MNKTVQVNALQMGTFIAIRKQHVAGIIRANVLAKYKMNVINALVRHGVVKVYHNVNVKLLDVKVVQRRAIKHRAPKIDDNVALYVATA